MVNIVINETKKEDSKTLKTILEKLDNLSSKNNDLEIEINQMKKEINELKNKKEEDDDKLIKISPSVNRGRYNYSDKFEPNKAVRQLWNDLKVNKDGVVVNNGRKKFELPLSIFEIMYVSEMDTPEMNYKTYTDLKKKFLVNNNTFSKIIYNIRKGMFKKLWKSYKKQYLDKLNFKNDNGYLMLGKLKTHIDLVHVQEWVQIVSNSDKKQTSIMKLQKEYDSVDKDLIQLICSCYDNNRLNKLLKSIDTHEEFIENNPSRRKSLIQSGGLIS